MKMDVDIFIPCFVDQLYPQTAFHMVSVLERLGCNVRYNPEQTCCGQPACNAGHWNEAATVAEKLVRDLQGSRYIVSPGGSCTGFIRNHYAKLAEQRPGSVLGTANLPIYEFTEFLTGVLDADELSAEFNAVAVYHDACGALRECGIKEGPRRLLRKVKGLELRETGDCETCCGFGGTFSVKFEPVAAAMGEQKVHNAIKAGAEYIISTDLSCLLHLEGYIKKHRLDLKTIHIADVLAQ